jgi:Protein of unknown function (DUF4235)
MMARMRVEGDAKEAGMADNQKKEDFSTRAFNTLTMLAAPFIARKTITVVWTKVTGKKPPTNPEDPGVALVEALTWSVLTGVTVAVLRLLATRAVARRALTSADREAADAADG